MGDDTILIFRGVERLLATAGGILSLVCGVLLYKWGTSGTSQLVIEHKDSKFRLTNAGPGLLMGLFGMVVVTISLFRPLENKTNLVTETNTQRSGESTTTTSKEMKSFYYSADAAQTLDRFLTDFTNKKFDAKEPKDDLINSIQNFQANAVKIKQQLDEAKRTPK